jgi:outer membrane immunogenic protein
MKKFLLSTVALATMTAGAMAADLPARRMAPAPYAAVPVFTWTGFYVGANVGAAWNSNRRDNFGFNGPLASPGGVPVVDAVGNNFGAGGVIGGNRNRTSILGGVQAGYNWQTGSFVVGVEGDIQAVGNSNRNNGFGFGGFGTNGFGTAVVTNPPAAGGVAAATAAAFPSNVAFFNNGGGAFGADGRGSNWFATARVRIGFAVDRALFYVTGGAAFTDSRNRNNGFFGGTGFAGGAAVPGTFFVGGAGGAAALAGATVVPAAAFVGNNDRNNVGWALGLGMEYAFTNNLSAKIEYLHLGFDGNKNNGFAGTSVVGVTNSGGAITTTGGFGNNRQRNNVDLVRVGLNFRFSGL